LKFWLLTSLVHSQKDKIISMVKYIITTFEYLTTWAEAELVENCTKESTTKFTYENIVTRFGYPMTIIIDQGNNFINNAIEMLIKKILIDYRKMTAYYPKANRAIESFNKPLHKVLMKICGLNRDDWDNKVQIVSRAYRIIY
jgi:hypothetical protein